MNEKFTLTQWIALLILLATAVCSILLLASPCYADSLWMQKAAYENNLELDAQDQIWLYPIQKQYDIVIESAGVLTPEYMNAAINKEFDYIDAPLIDSQGYNHWKTMEEFIADGGGNCKDFAIVKYHLLKAQGYKNVRIITAYGIDNGNYVGHAVVLLNDIMILDINPPYYYSYGRFIQNWVPQNSYDSTGVRAVKHPDEHRTFY